MKNSRLPADTPDGPFVVYIRKSLLSAAAVSGIPMLWLLIADPLFHENAFNFVACSGFVGGSLWATFRIIRPRPLLVIGSESIYSTFLGNIPWNDVLRAKVFYFLGRRTIGIFIRSDAGTRLKMQGFRHLWVLFHEMFGLPALTISDGGGCTESYDDILREIERWQHVQGAEGGPKRLSRTVRVIRLVSTIFVIWVLYVLLLRFL